MVILRIFLGVEILLFLMILPIKIVVKFRLNFDKLECIILVNIFKIQAISVKIKTQNHRIRITVNGKLRDESLSRKTIDNFPNIDKSILKLVNEVDCLGIVGGQDAMSAGQNHGLTVVFLKSLYSPVDVTKVYVDFEKNTFIFELKINVKITLFDALELFSKYGIKRYIKANC